MRSLVVTWLFGNTWLGPSCSCWEAGSVESLFFLEQQQISKLTSVFLISVHLLVIYLRLKIIKVSWMQSTCEKLSIIVKKIIINSWNLHNLDSINQNIQPVFHSNCYKCLARFIISTTYSAAAQIRQVRNHHLRSPGKSKNYYLDLIDKSRGSQRGSYFNWGTNTQRSALVNA